MCLLHQRIKAGAPNIRAGALTLFTDQSVRSKYQSGRSDTEWFFMLSKCRDFSAGAPILRAGALALFMEGFTFKRIAETLERALQMGQRALRVQKVSRKILV